METHWIQFIENSWINNNWKQIWKKKDCLEISRNVNTQSIENQSMSKAKLKKHLLSLTKEQITDIVLELYDAHKEAKDYLEFYLEIATLN